jgi:starch synthase
MEFSTFGLKEFYPGCWFEHYGKVNAMKTGIMFADKITTVSPTYAKEIRMPYYSEGLQGILNFRGADLIGILNGVYYDEWNPESDNIIYQKYDSSRLDAKLQNKYKFLIDFGLKDENKLDLPLIGMVSRLTEQKGIDLIKEKIEYYIANNIIRFALLGSGEKHYEDFFHYLHWKYPKNVIINIGYNNSLSHKIMASCDFLTLPSRYEPCGLTQMYALKYGTIPIVRSTGGLADTVSEYDSNTGKGTGFVFLHYYGEDFDYAIRRALRLYNNQPHWDIIRRNAMSMNFSSSQTALEYLKVFKWALEKVRGY